jgi:hypothetical protein
MHWRSRLQRKRIRRTSISVPSVARTDSHPCWKGSAVFEIYKLSPRYWRLQETVMHRRTLLHLDVNAAAVIGARGPR